MRILKGILVVLLFTATPIFAQAPEKPGSAEIYKKIKQLNFLGSVLYVAAHPDDENTRMISYLSNHMYVRTAYLSLTRGDGGQNLIGPEIREQLGLIRTHELLEARKIDGGEQFFSRANDFGYSKHPDETMAIWEEEEIISDVVWTIRKFRPDIIINRFDHNSAGRTHGHHTTSAVLGIEGFDRAADRSMFPEQLEYVEPWQPSRIYFNTSWWFYGSREKFAEADKSNMIEIPTGDFDPLTGKSNLEIASLSRSMHKSQGFGSTGTRGESSEWLELIKGDKPENKGDLFDGINTSWSRVDGGEEIGKILADVEANFDFTTPEKSVPKLLEAYDLVQKLADPFWKEIKTKELVEIISDCMGLYIEAVADVQYSTAGENVGLNVEMLNRSDVEVVSKGFGLGNSSFIVEESKVTLTNNQKHNIETTYSVPKDANPSSPYWLNDKASLGMYSVEDQNMRGVPRKAEEHYILVNLNIAGRPITIRRPLIYKFNDPVKGEVYRPFTVLPVATVRMDQDVYVYSKYESQTVSYYIRAGRDSVSGNASFKAPEGWKTTEDIRPFFIEKKGDEIRMDFTAMPPEGQSVGFFEPQVTVQMEGSESPVNTELVSIEYDHIPYLTILKPAKYRAVKLDVEKKGEKIAYIPGAGDVIPEALEQIGYTVTEMSVSEVSLENLKKYDAVVLGIRAYNTNADLNYKQKFLFEYAKQGGTVVVQYNTAHRVKVDEVAPYPLTLSRDRVTDEEAEITVLAPKHPVMNTPNKITQDDFENWTQERGLYFPNEWSPEFVPILACNDKGEDPKSGGLLVAECGEGNFVYTGISWFRQFPAGVPGAYRIFANIVSLGNE